MRIGVLGGGQLGRMLALAGHPLGLSFVFIDPAPGAPMAPLARAITADYSDHAALDALAYAADVVTWEFENVSAEPLSRLIAAGKPVRPGPKSLEHKQDRWNEKLFFQKLGLPGAAGATAVTRPAFDAALAALGMPAVIKTRRHGYDGKGQARVNTPRDADEAWKALGSEPLLVEKFIPFDRELSIVATRSATGEIRCWPLVENVHKEGILRISRAPAPRITPQLTLEAETYMRRVLEALEHVGTLALELFQVGSRLLVNEMAPRVHNSGHWTIEGAVTSQFENHLRAIAGLPLGDTRARGHSVMINLIGSTPPPAAMLDVPGAHLHLYGKAAQPRRKLGHVTVTGQDEGAVLAAAERVKALVRE